MTSVNRRPNAHTQSDVPPTARSMDSRTTNPATACDTFSAYHQSVYRWAYRVLGNHEDALDVTQEVFVKWWQAHRQDLAPTSAVGWLRRVTINHSINLLKARARHVGVSRVEPTHSDNPSETTAKRELAAIIADALSAVSERQRAVLVAKVYDGCTFAEIAGQMELSTPTVKTHYLRAIRAARRKLRSAGLLSGEPI